MLALAGCSKVDTTLPQDKDDNKTQKSAFSFLRKDQSSRVVASTATAIRMAAARTVAPCPTVEQLVTFDYANAPELPNYISNGNSNAAGNYKISTHVQTGYGIHNVLNALRFEENGPDPMDILPGTLMGVIMYILVAGIVISFIAQVMKRSLRRLVNGPDDKKAKFSGRAIAAVVFSVIAIVVGFMSDKIGGQFYRIFQLPPVTLATKWLIRAQIWVSMFIMLAVAIFDKVFLPDGKQGKTAPASAEPETPDEPETPAETIAQSEAANPETPAEPETL